MGGGDGERMEGAGAVNFYDGEFLFVWVGVGAEGGSAVVESNGAMGFLSGQRILICVSADIRIHREMGMGVTEKELSVLRLIDSEFQREVLDKLVRLETKMEALMGAAQPGRMKIVEDKVTVLERNDLRNSVYNRMVNASVSAAISVAIALHKYWWK